MKIHILKIGGSVATYKNSSQLRMRKKLLKEALAKVARYYREHPEYKLIIIHGAGGPGHAIAHKYGLRQGIHAHKKGLWASLQSRMINQQLNTSIVKIANASGLHTASAHTASIVHQDNGIITHFDTKMIDEALALGVVPVMYGEMVYDQSLGMSVCSGDQIAAYLAKHFPVTELFFATDVDGVYDADPHITKNAQLYISVSVSAILESEALRGSHNTDVTGGLRGKVESCKALFDQTHVKKIHIFNGLIPRKYYAVPSGTDKTHTILTR